MRESDLTSPDTLNLIKLADILKTDVEYLATGVKPVYESPPIVVNLIKKDDAPTQKVIEVEKPVIRRLVRVKYIRNPIEYFAVGIVCFLLGIAIGLLF